MLVRGNNTRPITSRKGVNLNRYLASGPISPGDRNFEVSLWPRRIRCESGTDGRGQTLTVLQELKFASRRGAQHGRGAAGAATGQWVLHWGLCAISPGRYAAEGLVSEPGNRPMNRLHTPMACIDRKPWARSGYSDRCPCAPRTFRVARWRSSKPPPSVSPV